mgnify:CR=1 FL=1
MDLFLIPYECENGMNSTKDALNKLKSGSSVGILIGPEGGIDDTEIEKATNIGGVVIPNKNGDNYLSDDPNNEFIKLIASTYNIDKNALVAIYSVPDSGTNYVLQFNGKSSLFGKTTYEKSPDNLYRVYHIGLAPERKISYTSGKLVTGNYNCEGAEGMLVFNLVQTKVMPQYPDYFEGV